MNALDQFVADSALSYLQSVVYVDDKIYYKPFEQEDASLSGLPVARAPSFVDEDTESVSEGGIGTAPDTSDAREREPGAADPSNSDLPDYHPKELMESFAAKGIVCAMYEPTEGEGVGIDSQIYKLCERADIVVLDWDLYNDDGDRISELLANLIKQSESVQPHHVRLCSIYTNRPSLYPIADSLLNKLQSEGCVGVEVVEGKLQLISGATRISILGKPHVSGRPPSDAEYEVEERGLAERLARDFCQMHKGLLSGFALKGLSAVRKNTKRLLEKFSCDLDGAFLLHRALVKADREALEELPELLADELSAILEDSLFNGFDSESVVNDVVASLDLMNPNDGDSYDEQNVRADLRNGLETKKPKTILRYGTIVGGSEHLSPEKLSHLFSSRTQYLLDSPSLKFGTIVKHRCNSQEDWEYSICLMPICDSRNRSKGEEMPSHMSFPFWRLNREVKVLNSRLPKKFAFVVEDEGRTVSLGAGGKIRDMLWLADMKLDGDGWARSAVSTLQFDTACEGLEIQWVSELKTLHAQRIAAYVGTEASRVGLTESEWLRLLCEKS